jgi:hypothetical protein
MCELTEDQEFFLDCMSLGLEEGSKVLAEYIRKKEDGRIVAEILKTAE